MGEVYWRRHILNSPGDDAFWNDGSYVTTTYSSGTPNIRISYQGDHSAVTTYGSNQVISKWGPWGLYRHQISYVPSSYLPGNPLSYYKRNTPEIVGNDVCGPVTFSVPNTPPGSTVSWSSSNSSALSINSGTGVASRVGSFNGHVTLTATFSGSCSHTPATKLVKVGSPSLVKKINGVIAGTTPVSGGNMYNLTASTNTIGTTTFNYNNYSGTGNITIDLYTPNSPNTQMYVYASSTIGSRTVRVTATNSCGSYYEDFVFYIPGGYFIAVYPNPTKSKLTIEIPSVSALETTLGSIVLISEQTGEISQVATLNELIQKNKLNDNKILLDVGGLPRGTYYLQLIPKDRTSTVSEKIIRVVLLD